MGERDDRPCYCRTPGVVDPSCPSCPDYPEARLIAARARLDELERRARSTGFVDDVAYTKTPIPPTPAELVEVLREVGAIMTALPDGWVVVEWAYCGRPASVPVPATLRAVRAVLTLMEENGR